MMTNEEILAILRQYPDLVPEVLAILTEAPAKTDLPFVGIEFEKTSSSATAAGFSTIPSC
mgnify:CR=1 FL=1